jgi:hypothetical protein
MTDANPTIELFWSSEGEPKTLREMLTAEPEWAMSRIRHCEKLESELYDLKLARMWHYPAHNLDVPNLPEPGQHVVAYYRSGDRICGPVVMGDLNRDDGPPTIAGKSIYQPVVRWCAIPEE